jgi:DNA-directed RNA polymerase specialized sigma24 family protein
MAELESSWDQGTVTRLIVELKQGQAHAAQQLWELYFRRMVELARHRLTGTPRQMADEEDIALSAFDSFCRGAENGKFTQLSDRENLWPLLVSITAHKAVDLIRYQNRKKRGGNAGESDGRLSALDLEELISTEPTPEFAAEVSEQFESLLSRLQDDILRSVALWKLEGFSNDEIAEKLSCVPRTVERKLQTIRTIWERAGVDCN